MKRQLLAAFGTLALLGACADTADVKPSGFLDDYAQLEKGRIDQAQLVYINPEVDFSRYERVLLEPVVVWERTAGSDASGEELRTLADDLEAALREQLRLAFELVESPSPGTLRIRAAITRVWDSGASVEMEILDAVSNQRLVAVADAREDKARSSDAAREWASAREAFDFWANRARVRLAAFRSFDTSEAAHDASMEP